MTTPRERWAYAWRLCRVLLDTQYQCDWHGREATRLLEDSERVVPLFAEALTCVLARDEPDELVMRSESRQHRWQAAAATMAELHAGWR